MGYSLGTIYVNLFRNMVKIIEEEKEIKCPWCKTKLAYTSKDIRLAFIVNEPYIECPVCGLKIFIE